MRLIVKANNDMEIIDFLADLQDRTPIYSLDKLFQEEKNKMLFIIDKHKKEGIITILICNGPFEVNENGNILMLFIHDDLSVVQGYFKRLMEATDYNDKKKRMAVRQMLHVIDYYLHHSEEFEKPQISNAEK